MLEETLSKSVLNPPVLPSHHFQMQLLEHFEGSQIYLEEKTKNILWPKLSVINIHNS